MTTEEIKKKIDRLMFGLHSTNPGDINALPEILKELVDMASAGANVQSDWNENDNTKADFIKNKPTIPSEPLVIPSSEFLSEDVIKTEATYNSILEAVRSNRRVVLHHPSGNVSTVVTIEENQAFYLESNGAHTLLVD